MVQQEEEKTIQKYNESKKKEKHTATLYTVLDLRKQNYCW